MSYSLLIRHLQAPVAIEQVILARAKIVQGRRGRHTAQDIQGIHATRRHGREIVGTGRTLATFIFALGVGLHPANIAECPLSQAKTFAFFPET